MGPDDKNFSAFAASCFAGLATLGIHLGEELLPIAEGPGHIDRAIATIVNAAGGKADEFHLLIDDYHHVEDPLAHLLLQKLIDHSPPNLHISIASRATPPLSVAKLRVMGLLSEIECEDLPFKIEETLEFLSHNLGSAPVGPETSIQIHEMTNGWPVSLQLLSLELKRRRQAEIDLGDLLWRSSDLTQYLSEEVVRALPPHIADFIAVLSLCQRFNVRLAEAMTGRPDASAMIDQIERDNLLLVREDDGATLPWFHFHPLFADFLRTRLAKHSPSEIDAYHRRASAWFDEHGFIREAIVHTTLGHDPTAAAAIAERLMPSLWRLSHLRGLHHLVNAIPQQMLASNPQLVYLASLTLALTGSPNQAAIWSSRLPEPVDREASFRRSLLDGVIALQRDDTTLALQCAGETPDADLGSIFERQALLGMRVTSLAASGRFDDAYRLIEQHPEGQPDAKDGMALLANGTISLALLLQGRNHDALTVIRGLYDHHEKRRGRNSVGANLSAITYAFTLYEAGEPDAARDMIANRQQGLKRTFPSLIILAATVKTRLVRYGASDEAALAVAEAHCDRFRAIQLHRGVALMLLLKLEIFAVRQDRGNAQLTYDEIERIAGLHATRTGLRAEIALAKACAAARLALVDRAYDRGVAALEEGAAIALRQDWGRWLTLLDLLRARIEDARAETARAQDFLRQALARGADLGLIRTFVDEGSSVQRLIDAAIATDGLTTAQRDHAVRLAALFAKRASLPTTFSVERPLLTLREAEILSLVAANMSNQKIADATGITLETVKWNLKNTFQKLDVANRYDAVMRARRTGLLD